MNPNANTFNPTGAAGRPAAGGGAGGGRQDSFTEYKNMVESIEHELDNEATEDLVESMNGVGIKSAPTSTSSGLPSHMKKHAAEFWFPESRDCACCKGFKHGCQCCKSGGICSMCGGPGGNSGINNAPAVNTHHAASNAAPPPRVGGSGGSKQIPCKFFRSPGGCRFGDNCRFVHA